MSTDVTAICSQWTAARKRLSQALDSFEAACNSLCTLGFQTGAVLESAQPNFLLSIEADLALLPREAKRITQPLDALKKLRNCSVKLVPINRLPPELLASIFSTAVHDSRVTRPYQDRMRSSLDILNVISSVSSYWRDVTLTTSTLWADIILTRAGGANHAALWFERSRSSPLYFRSLNNYYGFCEKGLAELVGCHSGRFKSLVLRSDCTFGQKLFHDACVQYTESSVKLETLAIIAETKLLSQTLREKNRPPKDQMDRYLTSVRNLYMRFGSFDDWTSSVFHNLTTLSLCSISNTVAPTHEELLGVLIASPRLRSLQLSMFTTSTIPNCHSAPVTLGELEILWLDGLRFQFVEWFLGSIVPQRDDLILILDDIAYADHPSIGLRLPFSIPERVGTLYIRSSHLTTFPVDLSGLLESSVRLKILALRGIKLDIVQTRTSPCDSQHPVLATLDLESCMIADVARFKSILPRHSVRQLRVSECKGCPTADELLEALPGLVVSETPGEFLTMFSPFD
ncbi:hypothetical protein BDV93DRAFT_590841 [Ceratobasidium sp. AG-I]|nr:hypothetical protein BDV93DRAFT_590841 [Ceratobasidium sp. AG-I]